MRTSMKMFRCLLFPSLWWTGCMIILCGLLLASPSFTASAQYQWFMQPTWHPSQNMIAVSNGVSIRVYNSDLSQLLNEFELTPIRNDFVITTEVDWSPDGTMLAVSIQGQDVISALQIWNVERSELIAQVTGVNAAATFAWNPQSTHIAVSHVLGLGSANLRVYDVLNTANFRDYDTGNQRTSFSNIRWSPDGEQIALNTSGGGLFLLDLESGQSRTSGVLMYADFELPRFVFSPDGRYLLGVTDVSALEAIVLDTATDQIVGRLAGHTAQIIGLNWVDSYIATVGYDGVTKLWDPTTFEEVLSLQTGITSGPSFSPDESAFVASANDFETIVVRNAETGAIIASLDPIALTPTFTPTATDTLTPSITLTLTLTFTPTATDTVAPTLTPTPTYTPTHTPTSTFTPTATLTFTPTLTPTAAITCTADPADPAALVSAINAANTNGASLDTICLSNSTYTFLTAANSIALPSITTPITIVGNGALLERGSGAPQFRLFNVTASGSLTLQNLTVRGFNAGGGNGGAILSTGTVTLDGVTVTSNSARFAGGIHSSGALTITNSTLSSNTSQEDAGAIYLNSGTLTVSDTTFQSNSARYGSGIYANDGTVSLSNVTFRSNTANEQGAGLFQRRGTVTITGGLFDANSARFGSAIYVRGSLSVTSTTFTNNIAVEEGAAIYNENGNQSAVTVAGSTFTGNRARFGGAIYNRARLNVTNSTFTTNTATESGGAVYHQNGNNQNGIAQSCFTGNTARFGGAVFSQTGNFNAQNNWWGVATGPTSAMVNNQVQFTPFLTAGCPN